MAKPVYYRAVFKTPEEKYYSRALPQPERHHQDAEIQAEEYRKEHKIKDEFVALDYDDEDNFI